MLDISLYTTLVYLFLGVVLAALYKNWLNDAYPNEPFNPFHFFGFVIFWMPIMIMAFVEHVKRNR